MSARERLGPRRLTEDDASLVEGALAVLDANWLGAATLPSPRLYPHQWSWDSAFVAIGLARIDQARAESELRSLFAGQWANGLLPHIVFSGDREYFPGPDFWDTDGAMPGPEQPRTSGIVQPPVHATAAWHVYSHALDRRRALTFLEYLMPRLVAWHEYLYRERTREGEAMVEIWHPWESGMDNSPLWDGPLARIAPPAEEIPSYERTDLRVAPPAERPSTEEYDRYAYLVQQLRDAEYSAERVRGTTAFAVQDALFNSLLVQSNRDLVRIAGALGLDPDPYEEWAEATATALDALLWVEAESAYLDFDLIAGRHIDAVTAAAFTPLFAGVPSPAKAARMTDRLAGSMIAVDSGSVVPGVALSDPSFQPALYWRGPIWVNINWLLGRGLLRYGYVDEARRIADGIVELVRRSGFREHYNPLTLAGQGAEQFAWTAALVLDLVLERSEEEGGRQ